jgi:SOS-response transcriptional repressor LexA
LIETGRVPNPPSDEKLRRLEQTLGFAAGQLVTQAHLQRTPRDVRAVLQQLMSEKASSARGGQDSGAGAGAGEGRLSACPDGAAQRAGGLGEKQAVGGAVDLDSAYLSGVLQELVDRSAGNAEPLTSRATSGVPVVNRVSAGYPRDFTDLNYPRGVADDYVSCPEVQDRDAFAARVHGDSMTPKYREGDIVIFSPASAPANGSDCFVRFEDGQTTFKRIFFENNEAGREMIRLQPRNEKYPARVLEREQISGLYKAVYKYQRVDEE